MWRADDPLPEVAPIAVAEDVGLLIRTLGDLSTPGGDILASYFAAVVERAAAIAAALALSADLLGATVASEDAAVRPKRSDR